MSFDLTIDPLQVIFQKHFFESHERNNESFCEIVVEDYINYLKYSGAIIPKKQEEEILEEVKTEIMELLEKYLKSHLSIKNYLSEAKEFDQMREESNKRYLELF